jgi:hypothetical protein
MEHGEIQQAADNRQGAEIRGRRTEVIISNCGFRISKFSHCDLYDLNDFYDFYDFYGFYGLPLTAYCGMR